LKAWVFKHFKSMGVKDVRGGYQDHHHPCAMIFLPLRGLAAPDPYRMHLDQMDMERCLHVPICWTPLDMSVWAGQFCFVHFVTRHPCDSASHKWPYRRSVTSMCTILVICWHIRTWGLLLLLMLSLHKVTSYGFIPFHINIAYFWTRLFIFKGQPSRRILMRLLFSMMENMGT